MNTGGEKIQQKKMKRRMNSMMSCDSDAVGCLQEKRTTLEPAGQADTI